MDVLGKSDYVGFHLQPLSYGRGHNIDIGSEYGRHWSILTKKKTGTLGLKGRYPESTTYKYLTGTVKP